jgi:hypothetical protein
MLARDEHSGFLRKFVTYNCKKSYNIGPWYASLAWQRLSVLAGLEIMLEKLMNYNQFIWWSAISLKWQFIEAAIH